MSTHKRSSRSTKQSSSNFGVVLLVIAVVIFICVFLDVKTGYDQIDELIHSVHVSYVEPLLDGEAGQAVPTPPTAPTAPVSLQGDESSNLSVQFVDVGQADCILAQCGDSYMLIDAGNNNDGPLLVKYFQELGIEEFEYVICTHAHEDHCGGLDDIFYNFPVKVAFLPYTECDTLTWKHVLEAVEFSEATTLEPHVGDKYRFGGASFTILSCDDLCDSNQNLSSIVIKLTYGDIDYMLTGDAETENEEFMLSSSTPLECEILKAGHHGSLTSNSVDWLTTVDPEVIVISVGANNKYNLPNYKVLERFAALGIDPLRTDLLGTITITTDGLSYEISYSATETNG